MKTPVAEKSVGTLERGEGGGVVDFSKAPAAFPWSTERRPIAEHPPERESIWKRLHRVVIRCVKWKE